MLELTEEGQIKNMMLQSIVDNVAFAKGKTNESFEAIQIERDLTSPAVSRAANKDFADFFFSSVSFRFVFITDHCQDPSFSKAKLDEKQRHKKPA